MSQTVGKIPPMEVRVPRIFVSAYACEPGLGSEIGVGWHWVLEMSKYFDLWVLTRESNRARIEAWFKKNYLTTEGKTPDSATSAELPPFGGYRGLHFIYFDLPKWARKWKKGLRGVRTYYNLWTRLSNPLVKKTMTENDIKVFHHITYGNALWQVSKYGASQTFIWGPIGGLETIPEEYSCHFDFKSRMIEKVRRILVRRAVKSNSLKKRCRNASLILCKTEETKNLLPLEDKSKAILFTDVATDPLLPSVNQVSNESNQKCLQLLCVGHLDAWRGFDLAILAVAAVLKKHNFSDLKLKIAGKGPDLNRLKKLVRENNLESNVSFLGQVSKSEYLKLMQDSDIVLNPSLKEGAVTVAFDAMTLGKPLIALDTGGYTKYFKPDYSIVIPKEGRNIIIRNLADAIIKLFDPKLREKMGQNALAASKKFTWENHGKEIYDVLTERIGTKAH